MLTVTPLTDVLRPGLAPPDVIFAGGVGDFASVVEGGLVAVDPIRTAVVILLFTDARCEQSELRFEHGGDRRGWVGDSFGAALEPGGQPLGSKLWLLRRSVLNEATARAAEIEALRALQPLIRQRVTDSIAVKAQISGRFDRLGLLVTLTKRDGRPVYSERFDLVWNLR